jgi:hypothetical protein
MNILYETDSDGKSSLLLGEFFKNIIYAVVKLGLTTYSTENFPDFMNLIISWILL